MSVNLQSPIAARRDDATVWWQRLARNRLLDIGAVLIALLSAVRIARMLPSRAVQNDFAANYVSSRLLLDGENPYTTDFTPVYSRYGFVYEADVPSATYPPPWLWFFAPFAMLKPRAAFVGWVVVQAASLCLVLWLTRRFVGDRLSARGWWFVCTAATTSATVYWHFYYSQIQLPLAAIVLAGYDCQRRGKQVAACLMVTMAGLLKLFPFALLPWFLWRRGRTTTMGLALAGIVGAFASVLVFMTGIPLWSDFFRNGVPILAACAVNHTFNFTLPSFIVNLGWAAHDFAPPADVARFWWILGTALGVASLTLAYLATLCGDPDEEAEFCLLCVAMLAGSVKAIGHYFVFLIFPVAVAAVRARANSSGLRLLCFGMMVLMLNALGSWQNSYLDQHISLKILANYVPFYGLLALGVFFVRELLREVRP